MRSINLLSFFLLSLLDNSGYEGYCQDDITDEGIFITYFSESLRNHEVTLKNTELRIKTFPKGLFPSTDVTFRLKKINDSVFQTIAENCLLSKYPDDNALTIEQFCDKKIKIISKDEFLILENCEPYFRKSYIDSLTNSELMFSINGKLKKRIELSDEDSVVFKKTRRRQVKWWKGKEAFDKYGAIGLYSVFEIKPK
ncbi:hypothetical protein [uncultured Aquimarina sp.]|uniref:hypothetical protein n=1 Tax=uncultured Aquimarina sp. TaxID=575652 RepID=UPI002619F472|nr:hypothetical protein [uncultured Aquimarina sp.]